MGGGDYLCSLKSEILARNHHSNTKRVGVITPQEVTPQPQPPALKVDQQQSDLMLCSINYSWCYSLSMSQVHFLLYFLVCIKTYKTTLLKSVSPNLHRAMQALFMVFINCAMSFCHNHIVLRAASTFFGTRNYTFLYLYVS